jgi:hypothetical protein
MWQLCVMRVADQSDMVNQVTRGSCVLAHRDHISSYGYIWHVFAVQIYAWWRHSLDKMLDVAVCLTRAVLPVTSEISTFYDEYIYGFLHWRIICLLRVWHEDKLCTFRHKWFQHVHRMEDNRLRKQLLNYHAKGRRRPGRPRKRLLDDITAETETGHPGLNSWWNMIMMMMHWIIASLMWM